MVTKELLYPFQFVVTVLRRSQRLARVRDLLKANEVIDEVKQHEDISLTFRVLDFTSCGLIGVSDVSLSGVDRFSHPTDQDSKTVKVHSTSRCRDRHRREATRLSLRWAEASSTCLNVILARSHECVARARLQRLENWALQVDSMQFYAVLLNGILGRKCTISKEFALETKRDRVAQDDRDGSTGILYNKVSTEKGGASTTEGSDTGKTPNIQEWLAISDS